MPANAAQYRQQADRYRDRLTKLAIGTLDHQKRPMVVTTARSKPLYPESDLQTRMTVYGRRRQSSVARVMALLSVIRDVEILPADTSQAVISNTNILQPATTVVVNAIGAKWQAMTGTADMPACHTCPALLELNGALPTYMTNNIGLRRQIIVTFADCMMMPKLVNDADGSVDSSAGKQAFANAGSYVINNPGVNWQQGLLHYIRSMRDILGPAADVLFMSDNRHWQADTEALQIKFEAVVAFYEGLFLTPNPANEVNNFMIQVQQEMLL